MLKDFLILGKASFILGGQYGSEAKGAAAAWVAHQLTIQNGWQPGHESKRERFDIVTTNAGAQAGHISIHDGVKNVVFHLPTAPLIAPGSIGYLNAGSIIDPDGLFNELQQYERNFSSFAIHPNAAVITEDCRQTEARADSAQTRIASTRKGVGEALARKVLRKGQTIVDQIPPDYWIAPYVRRLDLNKDLHHGKSVLVEVPQGIGLSLNGPFYPYCTSRDCTVMQAASDAQIHPSFVGPIMLVLRTFPIRVGNVLLDEHDSHKSGSGMQHIGWSSGSCYPDQRETTWDELGVPPEITTVTKRVRRVFTWSHQQVRDAFISARPTHVFLSHVDYLRPDLADKFGAHCGLQAYGMSILTAALEVGIPAPQVFYSTGPTTADVREWTP